MAASARTLALGNCSLNGEWTVVERRRGKERRYVPRIKLPEVREAWTPADANVDTERVSKLLQMLETCIKRMENSQFYQCFVEQIENSETFNCFHRVLGSESEMQVVVYGIGSIDSYETPRLQLSLLLLMKRKFSWIGGIEVFDPILSATESRVLQALGCSVLSVNEQGRRCALKPTLFYMPHCEAELYDNLLHANQEAATLKNVVLFGNSFETYEEYASAIRNSSIVHSAGHILALRKFTSEYKIQIVSDDSFKAFHDSSWHFFHQCA